MKRRELIKVFGGATLAVPTLTMSSALGAPPSSTTSTGRASVRPVPEELTVLDKDGLIGGRPIEEIRDRYAYDLFDDFLPFVQEHVIDHQYGGFMCNADRRGNQVNTNKTARFEGRGTWVYSYLYRNLAPEDKYLEVAHKSVEFLMRHKPDGDTVWPSTFERDGTIIPEEGIHIAGMTVKSEGEVYDDLFIAEGFTEYSRAAGKEEFWDLAKDLMMKSIRLYDQPDYAPYKPRVFTGQASPPVPGCRILGVWMCLIRLATQMLEVKDDPEVKAVADRCIESIFEYHLNPEYNLLNEVLNHDMTLPDNIYAGLAYTGHGTETLWMVLFEAHRRRDKALFDMTAEHFKRHLEVSWDHVYGGWFRGCLNVDDHVWFLDKAAWVQAEGLIGLLFIIEHTGAQWAKDWFRKGYSYVINKYPLEQHGYPLWDTYPDRKVTFVEDFNRIENFHHPRHLMLNLEMLNRMIQRGGRTSKDFV